MKTVRLEPRTLEAQLKELLTELREHGRSGPLKITIAADDELVSPTAAGRRLGFSRQHVMRLVAAGDLEARRLEGSSYWKIPVGSLLDFEERRERRLQAIDDWGRSLDEAGAPAE